MKDEQIEVYDFYFVELEKILNHLNPVFGESNNLFEKRIGIFHVFKSIMKNFKFLRINYVESPFSAFATLSRMIIDHYAAFFLISSFSNKDEQKIRYYLFIIASLEGRVKTMSDFEKSVSNLPSEISSQNQMFIELDQNAIKRFILQLETEQLKTIIEEKHIKNRNWRFPSEVPAGNKNTYSWQELYKIAKIPDNFSKAIQKHFSEFTHGLGLSILYTENKIESKQSIVALLCMLESLIGQIIINEFPKELEDLDLDKNFIFCCNYNWENWK